MWPDQVERFRQLAAAIDVARRISAHVDQGNAPDWVETAMADGVPGVAKVVYQGIREIPLRHMSPKPDSGELAVV